jgi:hypothetical protein
VQLAALDDALVAVLEVERHRRAPGDPVARRDDVDRRVGEAARTAELVPVPCSSRRSEKILTPELSKEMPIRLVPSNQ